MLGCDPVKKRRVRAEQTLGIIYHFAFLFYLQLATPAA